MVDCTIDHSVQNYGGKKKSLDLSIRLQHSSVNKEHYRLQNSYLRKAPPKNSKEEGCGLGLYLAEGDEMSWHSAVGASVNISSLSSQNSQKEKKKHHFETPIILTEIDIGSLSCH